MHVWSTEDVPERERFALWRDWRAAHLYGLTVEMDPAARRHFQATIRSRSVGHGSFIELRATPYLARRTSQDIARVRSDSLCIYQQVAGSPWTFRGERGPTKVFPTMGMAIGYSDLPYETEPLSSEVFATRLIQIPLTREQDPYGQRESMVPRLLRPKPGLNALLHDYVQSFVRNAAYLGEADGRSALETMSRLALLAHADAQDPAAIAGGSAAVAAARLALIQTYVCDHLHRADLSPESVARAFRISLRQVHRLFQPSGTTFARFILAKRVERAAHLLCVGDTRAVIDIAFACGFSGSSVFYRAFKDHFGMIPTDYLKSFGDSAEK